MSLGVYIQVPFCQTKCTYCNFHTGVVSRDRYAVYADAVCREIALFAEGKGSAKGSADDPAADAVDTVYIGGGTPSLLDPSALAKILDTLRSHFATKGSSAEITLEADPETITNESQPRGWPRVSTASAWERNRLTTTS